MKFWNLYKILKKVTDKRSAINKVQKFEKKKDWILAYSEMRYYYGLDEDKYIYG